MRELSGIRRNAFILGGGATAIALVALIGLAPPDTRPSPSSLQSVTPTPSGTADPFAFPIYTRQEAISRSVAALVSAGITTTIQQVDAKLISTSTLVTQWFGETDASWLSDTPVWLVGVKASGVTQGAAEQIAGGIPIVNDPTPVGGAFFAWDANSGRLLSSGALDPYMSYVDATGNPLIQPGEGYDFSLINLDLIQDETLSIEHATAVPEPEE